jgi:RES domain-containing protein
MGQRDLVSLDVVVSPVLDLTAAGNYQDVAQRAGLEPDPQFLADLAAVPQAHCQKLADQARAEGVTAVLVPSAAAQGEKNLVIYIDVVAPKHVQLANGPDRTRLE